MAWIENIPPINADSEMEEGEIVDDLSDISSEEEFLLRQRLQVLENYNNVLERKKAKRTSIGTGPKQKKEETILHDLSEISATELEEHYTQPHYKNFRVQRNVKTHHKQKRRKVEQHNTVIKPRENKKRAYKPKRKPEIKIVDSSEESEDEYRNNRRKLAEAVVVNKNVAHNDKTSLSERLQKMLCGVNPEPTKLITEKKVKSLEQLHTEQALSPISSVDKSDEHLNVHLETSEDSKHPCQLINSDSKVQDTFKDHVTASSDDLSLPLHRNEDSIVTTLNKDLIEKDSDDDLELLRQHALKTKMAKAKSVDVEIMAQGDNKILSEDEDSDTTELRLICLKSALLKKAIEMKQKQKLQKRLSQSSNVQDEFMLGSDFFPNKKTNSENNTDIESVDMDMGSDAEEKIKENSDICVEANSETTNIVNNNIPVKLPKEDELEEDEDLLRAKLLTSLSKNLPNLVNPDVMKSIESIKNRAHVTIHNVQDKSDKPVTQSKQLSVNNEVPTEKRFIINLGDSDSEGEHEATKNLTKMHMKLSEQLDFQQRLDMFLKSTRMEVEKTTLPDVIQEPVTPKKAEKFVAKTVRHLPMSEQIEYKNLVKRMAELEKIKQARQTSMVLHNIKIQVPLKETLKQRNVTIEVTKLNTLNNLEEQIKNSRKHIAEESAKMLKLKEEGTKLSQKFKIVATELRNIKTAMALNRKQQRLAQASLTKIRLHHQTLLKSSINSTHSKINSQIPPLNQLTRLQKENNPKEKDLQHAALSVTVKAIPKGVKELLHSHPRLSVQIDVTNNKKIVKNCQADNIETLNIEKDINKDDVENKRLLSHPIEEKGGGKPECSDFNEIKDDYISPLHALGNTTWEGDPNAILCPFEVGGDCKDGDCKYLHTNRSK